MNNKSWRESRDPIEIMEIIDQASYVDNHTVLMYFAQEKKDLEMVEKLLNSGYFLPEEVARKSYKAYERLTYEPARKMILDFANRAWKESKNPEKIISTRVGLIPTREEDLKMKLDYFAKNDPMMYKQLLKSSYSVELQLNKLLEDIDANEYKIIDILLEHPRVLSQLERNPKYKEICQEAREMKKEIASAPKDWRKLTNYELIARRTSEENKWEILEYFAKNNEKVFNDIVRNATSVGESKSGKVKYVISEVIERYKNEDLDKLPLPLKNYILSLKEKIIQSEIKKEEKKTQIAIKQQERRLSWVDENNNCLYFFKLGNISLNSREDYLKVLNKYLDSNLTIASFCNKYLISDEMGFRKMLDKFSDESEELAYLILEKSSKKQAKYLASVKSLIEGLYTGKLDVEVLIRLSKTYSLEKINQIILKSYSKEYHQVIMEKIIDYYYKRLNEYSLSNDPQDIKNMLTNSEIRFIVGNEKFLQMLDGEKGNLTGAFFSKVAFLNYLNPSLMKEKVTGNETNKICSGLTKYNLKYKTNSGTTYIFDKDGNQVEVTREMIDMAYQFANENRLFPSVYTISALLRAIANGKLDNFDKTNLERKAMIDKSLELIKNITSIDKYFLQIDNLKR